MLSAHIVAPESAAGYYSKLEDGYYSQDSSLSTRAWWGNGAAIMGLTGEASLTDLTRTLYGKAPNGIGIRGKSKTQGTGVRAAFDLTLSAPKSVSNVALIEKDIEVVKAHQNAVVTTLAEVESQYSFAELRTGGDRRLEVTGNLTVAMFLHQTSRELDPELHTHCLVMNGTFCSDDKWRSLRNEGFYRDHRLDLGRLYQNTLGENLRGIGYDIERQPNHTIEIKGYDRKHIEAFSQRREQIVVALGAYENPSYKQREQVTLNTRPEKTILQGHVLDQHWQARAAEIGLPRFKPLRDEDHRIEQGPQEQQQIAEESALREAAEFTATIQDWKDDPMLPITVVSRAENAVLMQDAGYRALDLNQVLERPKSLDDVDWQNRDVTFLDAEAQFIELAMGQLDQRGANIYVADLDGNSIEQALEEQNLDDLRLTPWHHIELEEDEDELELG